MSKAEKPAAAEAPKKNKKMLVIILAAVLLIGGGAAAFFLLKPAHAPKSEAAVEETHPEVPPKYVELGTFTANLIHEEGDRYLQVAISLKISKPELEEKIKASNPEIMHRVNMLLQSKTPSELATLQGKEKLARDIKAQVEYVLGFRKMEPVITQSVAQLPESAVVKNEATAVASEVKPVTEASEAKPVAETPKAANSGISEVLFTSFIIQ
ncbi:MAG: flagellar basal body protein FliL [Gallionella sp.]|nr:flagellar basal body protein FliL [Gallionella sp.]